MKCPRCGTEVTSTGKFCNQCGEDISFLSKLSYSSTPPSPPPPPEDKPSSPQQKKQDTTDFEHIHKELSRLTSVRQCSDEALISRLRGRLSAWADSIPHHGIKDFGNAIEIAGVTEITSYHMVLDTTVESRSSLKEQKKPYEGEHLPQSPVLRQRIESVWDLPVEVSQKTDSEKMGCLVKESFRKQKCFDCMGRSNYSCETCRGNKTISCPDCGDSRQKRCPKCRGSGEIRCWSCAGKGTLSTSNSGGQGASCLDCQGKGTVRCSECEGGFIECSTCGSTGTITCPKCSGKGVAVCETCGGRGEVLNYLSFDVQCSTTTQMKFMSNTQLPQSFPVKRLKEQKAQREVIDEAVSTFPDKKFLKDTIEPTLAGAISELIASSHKSLREGPNNRITKERLRIRTYPVWNLAYRYDKKDYTVYFYGGNLDIYIEGNPITDLQSRLLEEASACLRQGKWEGALEYLDKIIHINPKNAQALALYKHIKKKHIMSMRVWSLLGGFTAGAVVVGFVLIMRHGSLNLFWPVVQAGLVSLILGYAVGIIISFFTGRRKSLVKVKKRIPYTFSLGTVLAFFSVIIFVFRYDPIRTMDTEQYVREFQMALPYGIPSVPWEDDIRFLKGLTKKFRPTGIDVSKAEKGLRKLEKLKVQKIRYERKKKKEKDRQNARARSRRRSKYYQRINQEAFDRGMERYENLVIQKKMNTKIERINYLSKLIKKYKNKGIDISRAYKELKRQKKLPR